MSTVTMEKLVALCKSRGFVYPGSEYLRRPCQLLGLRSAGRRNEEQRKAGLVEKVRAPKPV